jgi:DNA polymerase III subunit delta'
MNEKVMPWHEELWNKIASMFERNRMPHALLFHGLQGMGKRHFAKRLANVLLCEKKAFNTGPCNSCKHCRLFDSSNLPGYMIIEPVSEGKQIKIEKIRALSDFVYKSSANMKIILIISADSMNNAASNALLKNLEEPAVNTVFLLVSDKMHLLPATIISRCQTWRFSPTNIHEASQKDGVASLFLTPLKIEKIQSSSVFRQKDGILDAICSCLSNTTSPIEVVKKWLDYPLDDLLDFLYVLNSEAIKITLGGTINTPVNWPGFKRYANYFDTICLYNMLDEVNLMKKSFALNINIQLRLEALLIGCLENGRRNSTN